MCAPLRVLTFQGKRLHFILASHNNYILEPVLADPFFRYDIAEQTLMIGFILCLIFWLEILFPNISCLQIHHLKVHTCEIYFDLSTIIELQYSSKALLD